MNESHINQLASPEAQIDRLAAGELDHASRRNLFDWLDREPLHWRRCALALLEARELDQALADWQAEIPRTALTIPSLRRVGAAHPATDCEIARHKQPRRWGSALALAASLLLAFGLGVGARGFWSEQSPIIGQNPPWSSKGDVASASNGEKQVAPNEPAPADQPAPKAAVTPTTASKVGATDLISPYVRSLLERRGYEVESRHAVLPAILPDGRRVMLPVDQFQLRYVGHRTS